jgi:hypothetical protein
MFLATLAYGWAWLVVRPRRAVALLTSRRDLLAVVLALHAVLAFTLADHQAYPDRFFVEPYVALVWGMVFGGLWALVSRRVGRPATLRWLTPVAWALMLVVTVALVTSKPGRWAERRVGLAEQRRLAGELASMKEEYGSVWVLGSLHLLGLARTTNYSPVGLFIDPRVRAYLRYAEHPGEFHPPTESPDEKPAVIVATRVNERGLMRWIDREYRRLPVPVFEEAKVRVWLRNDLEERAVSEERRPRSTTCGDPIGDRSLAGIERPLTATDALALLRAAAGSLDCLACACDLDGSGRVSASDALRLLRLALGAKLEIRCPPCGSGEP